MRLIPIATGAAARVTPKGQVTHAVGQVFPPEVSRPPPLIHHPSPLLERGREDGRERMRVGADGSYTTKTVLEMGQWALFRNPQYFAAADEFHPERWLGTDPRFANDRLDIVQPFSVGPRACIGRK